MKGLNEFKTKANEDMDPSKIEQIEGLLDADVHSELADIIANITTILSDSDLAPEDIVLYLKHKIDSSVAKPENEGDDEDGDGEGDGSGEGDDKKPEGDAAPAEGDDKKPEGEGDDKKPEGDTAPAEGDKKPEGEGGEGEGGDEKAKGGLADGMSLEDIAAKHNVDVDAIKKEFIMGVKVEMEHTEDEELAKEIAKDHLVEDPAYYTKLAKVEKE